MSDENTMVHVGQSTLAKFEPQNFKDLEHLAGMVARSKLFAVQTPEAAIVIMLTGSSLGISPVAAMRSIHVVQGKAVLSSDLIHALVRRSGLCASWIVVETTGARCTITTHRKGEAQPFTHTWTIEMARAADLANKGTWKAYPGAMLRARCTAEIARIVYPDVLTGGVYAEGEIDESQIIDAPYEPEPREITAAEPPRTSNIPPLAPLGMEAPAKTRPASQPPPAKEHAAPKTEPAAQETTPANDPTPAESYVLAAFKECVSEIDLPGEAVAVWIKARPLLATIPVVEREAAWKVLCAKTEEVGRMKNAKVWLKKAIAEEDARRQGDNGSLDDKPPTGTDGPRSARNAPATGDATSAPVENTAAPANSTGATSTFAPRAGASADEVLAAWRLHLAASANAWEAGTSWVKHEPSFAKEIHERALRLTREALAHHGERAPSSLLATIRAKRAKAAVAVTARATEREAA